MNTQDQKNTYKERLGDCFPPDSIVYVLTEHCGDENRTCRCFYVTDDRRIADCTSIVAYATNSRLNQKVNYNVISVKGWNFSLYGEIAERISNSLGYIVKGASL